MRASPALALLLLGCAPGSPADSHRRVLGEWTWTRFGGSERLGLTIEEEPGSAGFLRIHATRTCCMGSFADERTALWDGTTVRVDEPGNRMYGFRSALYLRITNGEPYLIPDLAINELGSKPLRAIAFTKAGEAYAPVHVGDHVSRLGETLEVRAVGETSLEGEILEERYVRWRRGDPDWPGWRPTGWTATVPISEISVTRCDHR